MEELTIKAKNISGKKLLPGTLIYKLEENKFLSWLTKIGLRTIRVKEATPNDYKKELFFTKSKNEAVKSHTISGIDTSQFNIGEDLYISGLKPDDFRCSKGDSVGKEIEPGIYQVKLS